MRSPTSGATSTWSWWSTTTPGRLLWARTGAPRRRWPRSSTCSARQRCAADRAGLAPTARTGSPTWSGCAARNAELCVDPFHVVSWATDALDLVRRQVLERRPPRRPDRPVPRPGPGRRYALWKNPENLTSQQQAKLSWIAAHQQAALPRLPAQGTTTAGLRPRRRRTHRRCWTPGCAGPPAAASDPSSTWPAACAATATTSPTP